MLFLTSGNNDYSSDMIDSLISALAACRIFKNIPENRLGGLLESAGARIEDYAAGRIVLHQGDRYESLILVASGRLEARIDDITGRGLTVEHFKASSVVGTAVLISSNPVLPVTLIASSDIVLVKIEKEAVFSLFTREPEVLRAYLADAGDKVRFLAEKIRLLRFGSLRQRIAGHLISLSDEQKTDNPAWRYGREQTADLLGVARPSLSRELSLMIHDGLILEMDRTHVSLSRLNLKQILEET
jgi:CRP-like cAMP-binding protein